MKKIFHAAVFAFALCALVCGGAATATGQESNQKEINQKSDASRESYEVVLQLLKTMTPGETVNGALPNDLQPIARKLRGDLGNNDYGLMLTLLNRVSERGSLELKSLSPFYASPNEPKALSYYDVSLSRIQPSLPDGVEIQSLRFGIRLPVTVFVANGGNSAPVTSYEQFGITVSPVRVNLNEPTIVGTLTTSRPNELLVLVMTVKSGVRTTAKKN